MRLLSRCDQSAHCKSSEGDKSIMSTVKLTPERIEQIRLSADSGYIVDDDDWNDLCDMALANARQIDASLDLLDACQKAKKFLEPNLVEPGRSMCWQLVDAINNHQ